MKTIYIRKQKLNRSEKTKVFIFLISILLLTILLSILYFNSSIKDRKDRYYYIGENESNVIKDKFSLAISKLDIIENILKVNENDDFFDSTSKSIYDIAKLETGLDIINISLAKDGVINKVYPKEDESSLLGFNLLESGIEGNDSAIEAYQTGQTILTNFFDLRQGTRGLVIRKPVIINNTTWGLLSIAIAEEDFEKQLGFDNLSDMKLFYKLNFKIKNEENTVCSNTSKNCNYIVITDSYLNLTWDLYIYPMSGWVEGSKVILDIIGIVSISILSTVLLAISLSLKASNKKLFALANLDPLSKCYTRNYLRSNIINIKEGEWKDKTQKYSLIYLDIDNFKQINDEYGHSIGDEIIETLGYMFKEHLDNSRGDFASRIGGDEFVIFLKDISKEEIINKAEEIMSSASQIEIMHHENLKITLSLGIAFYDEEPSKKYMDMLQNADRKLYISKEKGKNQYTI